MLERPLSSKPLKENFERLMRIFGENFECFDSGSSSIIGELFQILDNIEAKEELNEISDPGIENAFAELVDEIINNPGQIPDAIKDKLSGIGETLDQWSFDQIGGPCTLRGI